MELSLKYNFLFVHLAKTGGTSIRAALARYRWRDPARLSLFIASRLSAVNHHRLGIKIPRHARAIAAQEMLPADVFSRLFKFAFVRNPWDLQVSSYHHIKRERPDLLIGIPDFPAFVRYKLNPDRPAQYHLDASSRLQTSCLIDLEGNQIVDFVGRYERLAEDFATVCQYIGISPKPLGQHRRATERSSDYRSYYDSATAEYVAEYFSRDIRVFEYDFDQPLRQFQ